MKIMHEIWNFMQNLKKVQIFKNLWKKRGRIKKKRKYLHFSSSEIVFFLRAAVQKFAKFLPLFFTSVLKIETIIRHLHGQTLLINWISMRGPRARPRARPSGAPSGPPPTPFLTVFRPDSDLKRGPRCPFRPRRPNFQFIAIFWSEPHFLYGFDVLYRFF